MKMLEWKTSTSTAASCAWRPRNPRPRKAARCRSGELAEVMARAYAARRLDCAAVFHDDGKPILDFRGAWTAAATKAGLGHLLVHDLRRCAIRNLVRAGVSEHVAMGLSGHKTRSVFDRYDIVTRPTSPRD